MSHRFLVVVEPFGKREPGTLISVADLVVLLDPWRYLFVQTWFALGLTAFFLEIRAAFINGGGLSDGYEPTWETVHYFGSALFIACLCAAAFHVPAWLMYQRAKKLATSRAMAEGQVQEPDQIER